MFPLIFGVIGLVAAGCGAKYVAQSWANSKLELEEAHAHSLLRELDRAKAAAYEKAHAKRYAYSRKFEAHQEMCNVQLKAHIDFMNEQLQIAAVCLPDLNHFQSFTFTCVDSWMHIDLCRQEIDIVSQKIDAVVTTIGLIDAYILELNRLTQRQERRAWREFIAERSLTVVNDFVEKTKDRIDRTSKANHDEFKNELKRLQSHRNFQDKEANQLRIELAALLKNKKIVELQHEANKKALVEKYESCVQHWHQIVKKFWDYYSLEAGKPKYVKKWKSALTVGGTSQKVISSADQTVSKWISVIKEGGIQPEIIQAAHEEFERAKKAFVDINLEYQPYKHRVQMARDSNEYPESFTCDNAQRKRLAPMVTAAYESKQALIEAWSFLYTRYLELHGYIERVNLLHPDAAIDAMCEILEADHEFNTLLAFGINTNKQKRKYWEKSKIG